MADSRGHEYDNPELEFNDDDNDEVVLITFDAPGRSGRD